ncbi:hypothetical protein HZB90_00335 [archaeon]|nr:hypothetical protein [archaeon]
MRKAQVAGQVFIYILAIVVVGLIIAYGYSAIKGFTQKGEQVEYITLKTGLENSFKGIISNYGSVKRLDDLNIPGKYSMVCFVDKDSASRAAEFAICTPQPPPLDKYHNPIACSGWKTGRSNVFLIPDGSDSFDVGKILFEDNEGRPFLCLDVVNNKIKLQLESRGNAVKVSEYS